MLTCTVCRREFDTQISLMRHTTQKHKWSAERTYIEFILNGVPPTCKCGCGERPKFLGSKAGYREYKLGHAARVYNNWGHNAVAKKKSKEVQKQLYTEGTITVWNKGLDKEKDERIRAYGEKISLNEERGRKISAAKTGIPKTEKENQKNRESQIKSWEDPKKRERQRYARLEYFQNRQTDKISNVELRMKELIEEVFGDRFQHQYPMCGYLFDFKLLDHPVLVEADGDWYHCNPAKHPVPTSIIQEHVVKNDAKKSKLAASCGYTLLRFWETDILQNPNMVRARLRELLTEK